jgi:hypothetical protein
MESVQPFSFWVDVSLLQAISLHQSLEWLPFLQPLPASIPGAGLAIVISVD